MKKLTLMLVALCLASPALAIKEPVKPSAPVAPREAVAEYGALRTQNSKVLDAYQIGNSTPTEIAQAKHLFAPLGQAMSAAYNATLTKPFNRAAFDKHAATARDLHSKACAILSGC
jgi:hypothetical protein